MTLSGITFGYQERPIFEALDLSVPTGKITAILGPSGTGKTTLLKLMTGQLLPDSGDILFQRQNIPTLRRSQLYELRKKMGMMFQSGALFPDLTIFENVAFLLREHTNLSESLIRATVLLKLEAVGLRGAAALFPAEISGGMARRTALARTIALDPDLVLFDEPFVGQDPITLGVLTKLIKTLSISMGITSLIVSHDIHAVMAIADYGYILTEGRVAAHGSMNELQQCSDPRVSQFLSGSPDGPVPFHYPAMDYKEELFGFYH